MTKIGNEYEPGGDAGEPAHPSLYLSWKVEDVLVLKLAICGPSPVVFGTADQFAATPQLARQYSSEVAAAVGVLDGANVTAA